MDETQNPDQEGKESEPSDENSAPVTVVGVMTIAMLSNGVPAVKGFPSNMADALMWLGAAQAAIASHFLQLAKNGELDEKDEIVRKMILDPNNPDGELTLH